MGATQDSFNVFFVDSCTLKFWEELKTWAKKKEIKLSRGRGGATFHKCKEKKNIQNKMIGMGGVVL